MQEKCSHKQLQSLWWVFKTHKKTSVDRLLSFLSLDLQNDVKSQTMSKKGSNVSKSWRLYAEVVFCFGEDFLLKLLDSNTKLATDFVP